MCDALWFEESLAVSPANRQGALAQLVARRSHNPKVVSSILTGPILQRHLIFEFKFVDYFDACVTGQLGRAV